MGVSLPEDRASFVHSFLLKMLAEPDWTLGSRGNSKGPMYLNGDFTFLNKKKKPLTGRDTG